jgi:AcrR family transcriptional regulator
MDARAPKARGRATAKSTVKRKRDPVRTRQEILDVASEEFAENGLSGGNTDAIAARAKVTKRLVFYYFKTKEDLFVAVLNEAYGKIRAAEADLGLDDLAPEEALRRLVEFTFDYDNANPYFVRLVMIENIHRGRHLVGSDRARAISRPIIDQIDRLVQRGVAEGVMRAGLDAVSLHRAVSALCFFSVSNRHTFEALFGPRTHSKRELAKLRADIVEMVWRYVRV